MKTLKIKNITLSDDVETKEAKQIYKVQKLKYSLLIIIPVILFLCFIFCLLYESQQYNEYANLFPGLINKYQNPDLIVTFLCLSIITFLILIINIVIFFQKLKPYKELIEIAEKNDKIRHEEKIREMERQRLRNEPITTTYTIEDIEITKKQGE